MLTYAGVCYTGVDAGCRCNRSRAWERDGDDDAHALLQDARCFVDCTGTSLLALLVQKVITSLALLVQKVLSLLALLVQKYKY
jgi:hypothetical protein